MKVRLPVLVQSWSHREGGPKIRMQLWFAPEVQQEGTLLLKVQNRMLHKVRQHWNDLRQEAQQEALARFAYSPGWQEHRLVVEFTHKKRSCKLEVLATSLPHGIYLGQFQLWLQRPEDGNLQAMALEATRHVLRDKSYEDLEDYQLAPKYWLSHQEVQLEGPAVHQAAKPMSLMALLGGQEERDGGEELQRVGRKLEQSLSQFAFGLQGRENELAQLQQWMSLEPRSSVLLVGPRQAGKTAIIFEAVRRSRGKGQARQEHWLVSPARLISGMSILGQWETRLLKILRWMRKRNLVLVLDDLLGLLSAGQSRHSSLSVAQVLKPFLQRRQLRVIAEITPEQLHLLRQKDPSLVDPFLILPVPETGTASALQVALACARHCEDWQGTHFNLPALQTAVELCERYLRDTAFPGKAAVMVRQLAARYRGQEITPNEVLDQFQQRSGLRLKILDDQQKLDRGEVLEFLRARVLGQEEALQASADAACLAKTRLQSSQRPIASFLFVGPTGVGKTECARALAEYLYGGPTPLVRVDLNEYVGEDSVTRLVGSFLKPQGWLTEAIRRQPFCVLLLDEVEKAHPKVLQLLLQILGDGRLSDALGRTSDFSQCIVILTSNLGAGQVDRPLGLRGEQVASLAASYRKAAEEFFSPELFNRIDRIVAFRRLERSTVAQLAMMQVNKILKREGLQRRQCLLEVAPEALQRLTDLGYHPQLGARALKRAVETHLTGPVAARLAAMSADSPTLISLQANLEVEVVSLRPALAPTNPLGQRSREQLGQLLSHWEQKLLQSQTAQSVSSDDLQEEQLEYFERREALRALRQRWHRSQPGPQRRRPGAKLPELYLLKAEQRQRLEQSKDLLADLQAVQEELRGQPRARPEDIELLCLELEMRQWLHRPAMVSSADWTWHGAPDLLKELRALYQEALPALDLEVQRREIAGPFAAELAESEQGLHLFLEGQEIRLARLGEQRKLVRIYASGIFDLASGIFLEGEGLQWVLRSRYGPVSEES